MGIFPELILLDLKMPVLDGFAFLDTYQARGYCQKYQAILSVLTTSSHPEDLRRLQQVGFANYLPKPLTEMAVNALVALYQQRSRISTSSR